MRLFADPARLDRSRKLLERDIGGKIGEIIFALASGAMLADDPGLLAGRMLSAPVADTLGRTVGDPHAEGRKARREVALLPRRQLTLFQRAVSSIACAVID